MFHQKGLCSVLDSGDTIKVFGPTSANHISIQNLYEDYPFITISWLTKTSPLSTILT
jgi:hypothetical protein